MSEILMPTATLVSSALAQFCPTTNHYRCSDGKYLLVTIPHFDVAAMVETITGIKVGICATHLPKRADVFLATADAVAIDADDDPLNDLTPLLSIDGCSDFAAALQAAGYQLREGN